MVTELCDCSYFISDFGEWFVCEGLAGHPPNEHHSTIEWTDKECENANHSKWDDDAATTTHIPLGDGPK